MKIKKYFDYHMDIRRSWATASGALMGFALFARSLHYFGICDMEQVGTLELVFRLILPLLLCAAYVLLIRIVKLDMPVVFAAIGGALYLLVFVGDIFTGDIVRIVLSGIASCVAVFLLLATAGGFLPDKIFVLAVGFLIPVLWLFIYYLPGIMTAGGLLNKLAYFANHLTDVSDMAVLLALFCLPMCLKDCQT